MRWKCCKLVGDGDHGIQFVVFCLLEVARYLILTNGFIADLTFYQRPPFTPAGAKNQ